MIDRMRVLLAASIFALVAGCGRVGNLRPPEATAPAPVKFPTAEGTVDGVKLTWQAPTEDASGNALKSLDRYLVERSDYRKGDLPDFSTIAEVPAPEGLERRQQEAAAEAADSAKAEKKKLDETAFGMQSSKTEKFAAPLSYLDNTVEPGKRYDYRVRAVNSDAVKGRADLFVRITFAGEASRVENVAVTLPKK